MVLNPDLVLTAWPQSPLWRLFNCLKLKVPSSPEPSLLELLSLSLLCVACATIVHLIIPPDFMNWWFQVGAWEFLNTPNGNALGVGYSMSGKMIQAMNNLKRLVAFSVVLRLLQWGARRILWYRVWELILNAKCCSEVGQGALHSTTIFSSQDESGGKAKSEAEAMEVLNCAEVAVPSRSSHHGGEQMTEEHQKQFSARKSRGNTVSDRDNGFSKLVACPDDTASADGSSANATVGFQHPSNNRFSCKTDVDPPEIHHNVPHCASPTLIGSFGRRGRVGRISSIREKRFIRTLVVLGSGKMNYLGFSNRCYNDCSIHCFCTNIPSIFVCMLFFVFKNVDVVGVYTHSVAE